MEKIIRGKVWRFGDNVDTDQIFPGQYLSISKPEDMVEHCMEGAGHPRFLEKAKAGDIIVAGNYFGCGSSREQAPVSLKHFGISAVIAEDFARIFFRNGLNVGLPVIEAPGVSAIQEGNEIEVDLKSGLLKDLTSEKAYRGSPIPNFLFKMLERGGLVAQLEERFLK